MVCKFSAAYQKQCVSFPFGGYWACKPFIIEQGCLTIITLFSMAFIRTAQ